MRTRTTLVVALLCLVLFGLPTSAGAQTYPNMPVKNSWLTDSVYPISHFNPGATDSVLIAGPTKGKKLTRDEDVKVISNVMVSNPVIKRIGSDTVAFASGTLGIRKLLLTGKAFEDLSITPYPGLEKAVTKGDAKGILAILADVDAARREMDDAKLLAAIGGIEKLGVNFLTGINGVYNLFDKDGFHYCIFGGTKVLKSTDDNKVRGEIRVVKSVDIALAMPPNSAKPITRIIGLNMTYDGYIALATPGALIILDRDLSLRSFVAFTGEIVDNSIAIDEKNGIYIVTSRRMLKVAWNGKKLSTDEKDGAWVSGYELTPDEKAMASGAISRGSGTTPTLMGFGDDPDKLVVIADAAASGTNAVAFWRDAIPTDFRQRPGTKSRRIADQARIEISTLTVEPSPNVFGYGVTFVNGSYPKPVKTPGFPNAFTAGVTRPAPLGVQKFVWNPANRRFEKAWINHEVDNSDMMVPVVSAKTGLLYCAHKENGNYQYVGLDWMTGKLKERWLFPDDSRLWNGFGGITTILEDGDLLIGGAFGIKRVIGDEVK